MTITKTPFTVNKWEIDYFKTNHPIHFQVLMELIRRGDAQIINGGQR